MIRTNTIDRSLAEALTGRHPTIVGIGDWASIVVVRDNLRIHETLPLRTFQRSNELGQEHKGSSMKSLACELTYQL